MSEADRITALRAFVPARDFALSQRFYAALGFATEHSDDSIAIFERDGFGFILQNFYVKELAENFMLQLMVTDIDSWWERAAPERLVAEFGVRLPTAPTIQPWGLKVGFIADPSGVLWHVTGQPR